MQRGTLEVNGRKSSVLKKQELMHLPNAGQGSITFHGLQVCCNAGDAGVFFLNRAAVVMRVMQEQE